MAGCPYLRPAHPSLCLQEDYQNSQPFARSMSTLGSDHVWHWQGPAVRWKWFVWLDPVHRAPASKLPGECAKKYKRLGFPKTYRIRTLGGRDEEPEFFFFNLFIHLWLCWVFVSVRGLSLVVASGGHSSSRCAGLLLSRPLLLRSTGSRRAGSVIVAHGPSCSVACGIFPDQGSNLCPLHWQADSQPLRHQGSPRT